MHLLTSIAISNFRSISSHTFPLSALTPLVGYNNAGKTNILSAIYWLCRKHLLPSTDFYNPTLPIVVSGIIDGISDNTILGLEKRHREKLAPLIVDGKLTLRRVQPSPDSKLADIRLEVQTRIDNNEEWQTNPAGIDAAIAHLFPEPILIGAMEDITADVGKFGASTTIGKLIKEIIDPVARTHSETLENSLSALTNHLSADAPDKDPTLSELDASIDRELANFFPGVSAKVHIATPSFGDLIKGATIRVFETLNTSPGGRDAASLGHGAQRSIQLALIKCLSEIKRPSEANSRNTLLLIDEPELYLHPQAIEVLRASLARLSHDKYQVIFTTHSPIMIDKSHAPAALLVRREELKGTYALPRVKDAIKTAIAGGPNQAEILFDLSRSAKFLFCERVLLCEGKTEHFIIPEIYQVEHDRTLGEDRIGLLALSGAQNIPNALVVLKAMGVPAKALVDLDFAFRQAIKHGLLKKDDSDIKTCIAAFKDLEQKGDLALDEGGLPTKKGNVSAAKAFELMAARSDTSGAISSIHRKLRKQAIWCWTRGAIESHCGLAEKTDQARMAFIQSLGQPQSRDAIPHYNELQEMLDWARN